MRGLARAQERALSAFGRSVACLLVVFVPVNRELSLVQEASKVRKRSFGASTTQELLEEAKSSQAKPMTAQQQESNMEAATHNSSQQVKMMLPHQLNMRQQQQQKRTRINVLLSMCTISIIVLAQYNLFDRIHVEAIEVAAQQQQHPAAIVSQQSQQQTVSSASNSIIKHQSIGGGSVGASAAASSQLPKLPKINIYLGRNEIKRLLGIDTKINYVSEGNINTYPLGFTIPLGYNQSEMIFTWQNLGQTNVNYSITLALSDMDAVVRPIINITRTGLIPKHEQVFRISLPCSGKLTSEVDVEVFISISGFVPDMEEQDDEQEQQETNLGILSSSSLTAADDSDGGSSDEAAPATPGGDQLSSTTTAATGPTTTTTTTTTNTNTTASSTDETLRNQMQSDQASDQPIASSLGRQPRMRPVSHTLAIKRKKICTMHPVPVQPAANIHPATQPTQRPVMPQQQQTFNHNRWNHSPTIDQSEVTQTIPSSSTTRQVAAAAATTEPGSSQTVGTLEAPMRDSDPIAKPSVSSTFSSNPTTRATIKANLHHNHHHQQQQQQQATAADPHHNNIQYNNNGWPVFPSPISNKIPHENPLNEVLAKQRQAELSGQQANGSSFVVPVLALLSVLISLALIVVVLLAAASSSSSFLFNNKLNALKSCLLLRSRHGPQTNGGKGTPASLARANGNAAKSHHLPNSLRAGLKSSAASSVSGLSAISGHSHLMSSKHLGQQSYCYKPSHYATSSQYYGGNHHNHNHHQFNTNTNSNNNNNPPHYQQLPPTADLLGTGYQSASSCQSSSAQQYPPIYHIETASNPSQTTRLFWQNGNGTSPDGFTTLEGAGSYMPLSNHAPRSDDTGSAAYQTIY